MSWFESIFQIFWVTSRSESILQSLLSQELIWIKILESFLSHELIWINILKSHLSHESIWIKFQKIILSRELVWINSWKPLWVMSLVRFKTFWDWVESNRKKLTRTHCLALDDVQNSSNFMTLTCGIICEVNNAVRHALRISDREIWCSSAITYYDIDQLASKFPQSFSAQATISVNIAS